MTSRGRSRRAVRPPLLADTLRAAGAVKDQYPDPSQHDLTDADYDAAFDVDELNVTVIGGMWGDRLTPEAREHARELATALLSDPRATAAQRAPLIELVDLLEAWRRAGG